jgi:hypothetical protein
MIAAELYELNMLASQSTTIFMPMGPDLNHKHTLTGTTRLCADHLLYA